MFDWDDLRHFLAVARTGSTLAAARALRVSQPTVARRVAQLEAALGVALFERRASGYAVTAAGESLLPKAEQAELAMSAAGEAALAHGREISGSVRISVWEIFAATLLAPILGELHILYPQVRIDLDLSDEVRDIAAGEADIAVRSAVQLSGGGLVCRRITEECWAYYCHRDYAAANDVPRSPQEMEGHAIIGDGTEDFWPEYREWRREVGLRNTIDIHHGAGSTLLAAVRSGFGIALLPCLAADPDPDLVFCFAGPATDHALWLVTSERLRRTPRVRVVMDFLAERMIARARRSRREGDRALPARTDGC